MLCMKFKPLKLACTIVANYEHAMIVAELERIGQLLRVMKTTRSTPDVNDSSPSPLAMNILANWYAGLASFDTV